MRARWEINYAPAGGNNGIVMKQKYYYTTLFGNINGRSTNYYVSPFNQGVSIDAAPGCLYDGPDQAYQKASESLDGLFYIFLDVNIGTHKKYACFIPSKSALAYHWNTDGLAKNLAEDLSNRNLVCTGEIPFNDYLQIPTAQDDNDEHIKLNQLSAAFIASKIHPITPPDEVPYSVTVVGPRGVQIGSISNYTAQYQGNLQFSTSWQVLTPIGIVPTLSNEHSETCTISVGNGTGQNGSFRLLCITMVKSLTGEMICRGTTIKTIYVRKLNNLPSIMGYCNQLKWNCSVKYTAHKPNSDGLNSDVSYLRTDWLISKFSDSEFSSISACDGALRRDFLTPTAPNTVGTRVTLG